MLRSPVSLPLLEASCSRPQQSCPKVCTLSASAQADLLSSGVCMQGMTERGAVSGPSRSMQPYQLMGMQRKLARGLDQPSKAKASRVSRTLATRVSSAGCWRGDCHVRAVQASLLLKTATSWTLFSTLDPAVAVLQGAGVHMTTASSSCPNQLPESAIVMCRGKPRPRSPGGMRALCSVETSMLTWSEPNPVDMHVLCC